MKNSIRIALAKALLAMTEEEALLVLDVISGRAEDEREHAEDLATDRLATERDRAHAAAVAVALENLSDAGNAALMTLAEEVRS